MELNNNQVEYLRGRAALIIEDPIPEMTEMWLEWANANIEYLYTKDQLWVSVEHVLPVLWVLSNLYDCPPKVVFNLMKRDLRKRVSMLGFYQDDFLDFNDANIALGEIISQLLPITQSNKIEQTSQVK